MMMRKIVFLGLLIPFLSIAQLQKDSFQKGLKLYQRELYKPAQHFFREAQQESQDSQILEKSAFYIASCAIRNNDAGADALMEQFLATYPASPMASSASLDVANFYFNKGDYQTALKWYDRVQIYEVSPAEQDAYNFQMGYALFSAGNIKSAQKYFKSVSNSKEYSNQAKYYLGYIAYEGDDYSGAETYFSQVDSNDKVNKNISYYQADMNFKQGKFLEAIAEGKQQLQGKTAPKERSEINKIIGESYFNLKQYAEAIPYLKEYRGKRGRFSNTDYYYLGYAYYQQKDYENAIAQFNKIVDGKNSVAQNAYYHLAECYLKMGKKQEALNAFRNASQMSFDAQIKKDATLNYARLSYEIGNPYESVPQVLQDYLSQYPGSNDAEIKELLINSYITSKNYKTALQLLEKSSDTKSKKVYQQVAFYRGLELYNENAFEEASQMFKKAQANDDSTLKARATYWLGESAYQQKDMNTALEYYKQFLNSSKASSTPEYAKGLYGLGYAYFNTKNYNDAISYFEKFIASKPKSERLSDAYLRIGDSHFANGKYWPAMESYNKVLSSNSPDADYAFYQKAISYGFVDRTARKIEELNEFVKKYPNSSLRQNALYELGNTYVAEGNTAKGTQMYNRVQKEYQNSSFVPRAMLREGLVYYNGGQNQKALEVFKSVATKYPNTSEAMQAIRTAKLIYVDLGQVDAYAKWVKTLNYVQISDDELDTASYEAAERQLLQGNKKAAIQGFEKYLKEFPNGTSVLLSEYNLAQLYDEQNNSAKALYYYERVSQHPQNEYTEQALVRISEEYVKKGEQSKVMATLKQLEQLSSITQNIVYAQSNLMKLYYEANNYPLAIEYAEKVLAEKSVDSRVQADAHNILARSYMKTNNEDKAKTAYANVLKNASGSLAAEAMYYQAYFENKEQKYEASNKTVQKLAKEYGGYKEFAAKGLVLMGKNFDAMGDAYQASYILESVVNNFKDYPEVVTEAEKELKKVKSKAAQSNSSVN